MGSGLLVALLGIGFQPKLIDSLFRNLNKKEKKNSQPKLFILKLAVALYYFPMFELRLITSCHPFLVRHP